MAVKNSSNPPLIMMEITVISAEGLKNSSSSLFSSRRLRPFVTLTVPPPSCGLATAGEKLRREYKTRVAEGGGANPTWGDNFRLPIDATFFYQPHSFIYLQLYTKLLMRRQTQLGWCQIPATDIVSGLSPPGFIRRLSYRLWAGDGSRGHGDVNITVKLDGSDPLVWPQRQSDSEPDLRPEIGTFKTVVGVPVTMLPVAAVCRERLDASCKEENKSTTASWPKPKTWTRP